MNKYFARFITAVVAGALLTPFSLQAYVPNDMDIGQQSYLAQIKVFDAWETGRGGRPEVVVAVLDTGVDLDHPDLINAIWKNTDEIAGNGLDDDNNGLADDLNGWDFIDNDNDPRPAVDPLNVLGTNHGTIIAGIIAATGDNGVGTAGIAYKAKIMPLRVLDSEGYGDSRVVSKAIDYAIAKKVDVINLSFQGAEYSLALDSAITRAWGAGIVVVTAAGNDGASPSKGSLRSVPVYPACNDRDRTVNTMIGVAAVNSQDMLSKFSDYGVGCVDLVAPGEDFYGTTVYRQGLPSFSRRWSGPFSGTSISTAVVSGAAALLKSLDRRLSAPQVISLLLQSADSIDGQNKELAEELGAGRLNMASAIIALKDLQRREAVILSNDFVTIAAKGGPHVRLVDGDGKLVSQWFAGSSKDRGEWRIAVGRLGQERQPRVVVTAGAGQQPLVRILTPEGKLEKEFLAYDKKFRGGVQAAVVDLNGDGIEEIMTLPIVNSIPQIRVFTEQGKLVGQWYAGGRQEIGSWSLAAVHRPDPHQAVIAVAKTTGKQAGRIRLYNAFAEKTAEWDFGKVGRQQPGVSITIGDLTDSGKLSVVAVVNGPTVAPTQVKVFSLDGKLQQLWEARTMPAVGYEVAIKRPANRSQPVVVLAPKKGSDLYLLSNSGQSLGIIPIFPKSFVAGLQVAR
ncbi:MAG: S8 family peptidase [bacterium]